MEAKIMSNDLHRRELLNLAAIGGAAAALPNIGHTAVTKASATNTPWSAFTAPLEQLGAEINQAGVPANDIDHAEGYRLFLRYLSCGIDQCIENTDPAFPTFYSLTRDGVRKYAGDNPDELYSHAKVAPDYAYRISGNFKETLLLECGIYSGDAFADPDAAPVRLLSAITEKDFEIAKDGSFELFIGGPQRSRNWMPLLPGSTSLLVRRYRKNPFVQPQPLAIERLGEPMQPKPLSSADMQLGMARAVRWAQANVRIWAQYADRTKAKKLNVLVGFHDTGKLGAPAGHSYLEGYWSVPKGKALIVTFTPPKAKYWNFLLCNYWLESLEWRFGNKINYNNFNTEVGNDGSAVFVICETKPSMKGVNWMETMGHTEGMLAFRAARLEGAMPAATTRLVDASTI